MGLWGTTLNSLPWWLGGSTYGPSTVTKADIPPLQGQPYPGPGDIAGARASDASYGDLSAAFVQPPYGGKIASPRTIDQVMRTFDQMDDSGETGLKAAPVSPTVSDNLMAGYLASRRSALAGLGFDPRRMAIAEAPPRYWALNGSYYPHEDQILSTGVYPSTTAHESMHRGMNMLREAGMLPKEALDMSEESIIRGQMLRNFGNTEVGRGAVGDEQIEKGRFYNENRNFSPTMDEIERAAQQLYAQRHPRGPR